MIEMLVRAVRRCPRTGKPVAILESRGDGPGPRLALPLSKTEAHALLHELHDQETLRRHAFALMSQVAQGLRGTLSAVEVKPTGDGVAAAHLVVEGPDGSIRLPVELGPALSLTVGQRIPLRASEALLPTHAYEEETDEVKGPAEVPEAFLRAFDD